jgi:hypothetical protein
VYPLRQRNFIVGYFVEELAVETGWSSDFCFLPNQNLDGLSIPDCK